MLPRAQEIATGRWPQVLASLGVDERFLRNRHGPCPLCGGKDRYRFDDKGGRGSWICNQCGAGDGFTLLQMLNGWDFRHTVEEVRKVVGYTHYVAPVEDDGQHKRTAIRRVWSETVAVERGDPVWRYLNRRVGVDLIPASLRFHPALAYVDEGEVSYHPAMVAAVTFPDGTGATLHRTYLTPEGRKADVPAPKKLMPGKQLHGASIKLGGFTDALGIAEGIETALAAARKFGIPVWSCISSGLMESWVPPEGIKRIVIAGDNDRKYGGQSAAYRIAHKLACAGFEVEVRIPEISGTDWADNPEGNE